MARPINRTKDYARFVLVVNSEHERTCTRYAWDFGTAFVADTALAAVGRENLKDGVFYRT